MICPGPLSARQKAVSRHNYNIFNLINGASYMCLGETVIILFAVRLNSPDYIIAMLGAMIYFGFLLLPLGKVVTARVGAARSQANFWVMRNGAALLVALSAPVSLWGSRPLALGLLLVGAFLFYGFRAAGVVMCQPLLGDICEEHIRGRFIAFSTMFFYVSGLVGMAVISLLLKFSQSLWMLSSIIIFGALMGVTASGFIRKIDETRQIQDSARKPVLPQFKQVLCELSIRRQLVAGMVINLALILTVPISMLSLKRGYHVSDTQALLFALVQFGAASVAAYASGLISERIGPRKLAILGYWMFALICIFWIFCPVKLNWILALIPFLLGGAASVMVNNAMVHYFLMSIPAARQVASSMFIAVATGAGAGVLGMVLGGSLLKLAAQATAENDNALLIYRLYFVAALACIVMLSTFVHRLVKVIDVFRQKQGARAVHETAECSATLSAER